MNSTVTHRDGMAFDVDVDGHRMLIDAHAEHGGAGLGPSPKTLMLTALAGCASMDIIAILRKMRAEPATLVVTASADLTADHPKVFEQMTVRVVATGETPAPKLWKAVAMSRDRYCGVAAMMRAHGPIRYVVELNGFEVDEAVS